MGNRGKLDSTVPIMVADTARTHTQYTRTSLLVLSLLLFIQTSVCLDESSEGSYLVDPASSHMLVSKIKPCMSKYKLLIL